MGKAIYVFTQKYGSDNCIIIFFNQILVLLQFVGLIIAYFNHFFYLQFFIRSRQNQTSSDLQSCSTYFDKFRPFSKREYN